MHVTSWSRMRQLVFQLECITPTWASLHWLPVHYFFFLMVMFLNPKMASPHLTSLGCFSPTPLLSAQDQVTSCSWRCLELSGSSDRDRALSTAAPFCGTYYPSTNLLTQYLEACLIAHKCSVTHHESAFMYCLFISLVYVNCFRDPLVILKCFINKIEFV